MITISQYATTARRRVMYTRLRWVSAKLKIKKIIIITRPFVLCVCVFVVGTNIVPIYINSSVRLSSRYIISHNVRLSVPLSAPDLHFRNWAAPQWIYNCCRNSRTAAVRRRWRRRRRRLDRILIVSRTVGARGLDRAVHTDRDDSWTQVSISVSLLLLLLFFFLIIKIPFRFESFAVYLIPITLANLPFHHRWNR